MSTDPQQVDQRDHERSGGVRIQTEMSVRVIGRDSEPVRRTGNICASGFFFEVEQWPGRPGDITVMEVSSDDGAHSFTTLASVVRVVNAEDARWSSIEPGVSFQFLPSDEATRSSIARTVRHIAEQHPEQAGELMLEDFQQAASEGDNDAKHAKPCIETGAQVLIVIDTAGGGKREITGVVGDITESVQADGASRFWVPVFGVEESVQSEDVVEETQPTGAAAGARSLIDEMWKELVPEATSIIGRLGESDSDADDDSDSGQGAASPGSSHLSGRISQISMPSALWLLDNERLSGVLEFSRPGEKIVLFLSEGRVIDAESPDAERSPREHLSHPERCQRPHGGQAGRPHHSPVRCLDSPLPQRLGKLRDGVEPIFGLPGQRPGERLLDTVRDGIQLASVVGRGIGETISHARTGVGKHRRRLTHQHLVQHAAQAVRVCPSVDVLAAISLFGAHVARGADSGTRLGERGTARRVHGASDPKVSHHRHALVKQDVLRLDVPVDDALPVRVVQRAGYLSRNAQGDLE